MCKLQVMQTLWNIDAQTAGYVNLGEHRYADCKLCKTLWDIDMQTLGYINLWEHI